MMAASGSPAAGHDGRTPTVGASAPYGHDQLLTYGYVGSSIPAWVTSVGNGTLTANYPDAATNNSDGPVFSNSSPFTGSIVWSGMSSSPCGTGQLDWLACTPGAGEGVAWHIYVRNLTGNPYGYVWYDTNNSCSGTCFYGRRSVIHEVLHLANGMGHDNQSPSTADDTVMSTTQPWSPNPGWNQAKLVRCDEAGAQLAYGLNNSAGVYADCFKNITNGGTVGLKSRATSSATQYNVCLGGTVTTTGRLAIETASSYRALSNMPLSSRTIWFDRKPSTSSTWTNNIASATASNASGNNWARAFSSGSTSTITYNFRAHYDGETGVDPTSTIGNPQFNITWSSAFC